MESILEARGIYKIYVNGNEKVKAIQNINLKIEDGKLTAIVGPSGCGKSTLLHLLGVMDKPSEGEIYFNGESLNKINDYERTKLRCKELGFVFQTFNLLPTYTALENVEIVMQLAGVSKTVCKRRALDLLEQVGLKDRIRHLPKQLSGGQRQRVAIARALANSPSILFADEPTGNLDITSGKTVIELLKQFNTKGQTIVMVTHNTQIAEEAHTIINMQDGKLLS